MQSMHHAGYVLAGGRSSRMGSDKALLPLHGRTLIEHVAQNVHQAVGNVSVIGPPERYGHLPFPVVADSEEGLGPLGGIATALRHSTAEWNLIVACDMPGLTADFLRWLVSRAESSPGDAVLPTIDGVRPEPLCGMYRRTCAAAVELAIKDGTRKVTRALAPLKVVLELAPDARALANTNTPEEWQSAQGACL